jgi:hypothetical protein
LIKDQHGSSIRGSIEGHQYLDRDQRGVDRQGVGAVGRDAGDLKSPSTGLAAIRPG